MGDLRLAGFYTQEIREHGQRVGFEAITGEYTDLVKAGVVDPAKVTITALENAASIAGLNLLTNTLITDGKEKKEPTAGAVT